MLQDFLHNFAHNLFKPILLFFYAGFLIPILRVQFEFPKVIYQALTIYLLLAIGWHGGEELAGLDPAMYGQVAGFMVLGFCTNLGIGCLAYQFLKRTPLRKIDAATVAGYYGSDSAGTFVTAVGVLTGAHLAFAPYMPVMLAVMEIPGCLVALVIVSRLRQQGMDSAGCMPGEAGYCMEQMPVAARATVAAHSHAEEDEIEHVSEFADADAACEYDDGEGRDYASDADLDTAVAVINDTRARVVWTAGSVSTGRVSGYRPTNSGCGPARGMGWSPAGGCGDESEECGHSIEHSDEEDVLSAQVEPAAAPLASVPAHAAKGKFLSKAVLHEVFLNPGIYLLFAGIVIGFISRLQGTSVTGPDDALFINLFQGILCLFLLEMGMTASQKLKDLRTAGWQFIAFALIAPNVFATLGMCLAHVYSLVLGQPFEIGTYVLFAVLCGAASYIAVPAVQRLAIPEASPTLPLAASLGVTFTYNVTVGIPVYILIAGMLTRFAPIGG